MATTKPYKFDFAISFAGHQRVTASEIATGLAKAGFSVFYDKDQAHQLLGEDGETYLRILFSVESRFYVVLVSKEYDRGFWTQLELQAIKSRELLESSGVLIPVIVSGYKPKWLSSDRIYCDLRQSSLRELIEVVAKKAKATQTNKDDVRCGERGCVRLSAARKGSSEYFRLTQEATKRLGAHGLTVREWTGPRRPDLNPIVECRREDRLVALRVKAVIDTLIRQSGPVKGEVEGELRIELDDSANDVSSTRDIVLYL